MTLKNEIIITALREEVKNLESKLEASEKVSKERMLIIVKRDREIKSLVPIPVLRSLGLLTKRSIT